MISDDNDEGMRTVLGVIGCAGLTLLGGIAMVCLTWWAVAR